MRKLAGCMTLYHQNELNCHVKVNKKSHNVALTSKMMRSLQLLTTSGVTQKCRKLCKMQIPEVCIFQVKAVYLFSWCYTQNRPTHTHNCSCGRHTQRTVPPRQIGLFMQLPGVGTVFSAVPVSGWIIVGVITPYRGYRCLIPPCNH